MQKTRDIGQSAEIKACQYLQQQGLVLIEKNFHCKMGEIDLIMKDQQHLVFVEVRFRNNNQHGSSLESVTPIKQRRITLTAQRYLQRFSQANYFCRFDVVSVGRENITWVKDAFQL